MCIFSQPVLSVNNTQIFARATADGTQFIVYEMNYRSSEENAMILPVPIRQPACDDSLRFIDLQEYTELFHDLDNGFPDTDLSLAVDSEGPYPAAAAEALEVFEVGNYIASFVPKLNDFSRLDKRFTLPESTWEKIPQYDNYGFAVFQLAAGAVKPHPMAFEFENASDAIFFPTMHIHDGEVHETEEFDHMLYLQHAGFDSRVYGYQNADVPDEATGLVCSEYAAKDFCDLDRSAEIVKGDLLVHRQLIRGNHPNRDTIIETFGDPTKPTLNLRPYWSYAPWLLVGAAVTWFFARRRKIKAMKAARKLKTQPLEGEEA